MLASPLEPFCDAFVAGWGLPAAGGVRVTALKQLALCCESTSAPVTQAPRRVWGCPRWQKGDEAASEPARRSIGADLATLLEAAEHTAPTAYRFQSPAALAERNDEELLQEPGPDDQVCLSVGWGTLSSRLWWGW